MLALQKASEQQIQTSDLKIGMYVAHLDRPWVETPFMFQGFLITNVEDITQLQQHCQYVYIDTEQGKTISSSGSGNVYQQPTPSDINQSITEHRLTHQGHLYANEVSSEEEMANAKRARDETYRLIATVDSELKQGHSLKLGLVKDSLIPLVQSIIRNPDPLMQMAMIKGNKVEERRDVFDAAVLAAVTGRQLGFKEQDIQELAAGALLYDIGMRKMPPMLLDKNGKFRTQEIDIIKKHVVLGLDSLKNTHGMNGKVLSMIRHHHERYDGSGYPAGLKGESIPVFGRIAAIVDCFNAITTPRKYANAMSPYKAAMNLYEWRNTDFDPVLVEHFIQAVGIYPIGTLVELSNGCVGVIISQNKKRRLNPTVSLLLDQHKQPQPDNKVIDLSCTSKDSTAQELSINNALEPGAYDIDLASFSWPFVDL